MRCWAATRDETKPASRSTLRCLDTVGWLIVRAATNWLTLRSATRSSSRMRRRAGSASTAKASTGTLSNIPQKAYACQGMWAAHVSWSGGDRRGVAGARTVGAEPAGRLDRRRTFVEHDPPGRHRTRPELPAILDGERQPAAVRRLGSARGPYPIDQLIA